MFIVFTGIDGSGTSSIAYELHKRYKGSFLLKSLPEPYQAVREIIDSEVRDYSISAHAAYYLSGNLYLSEQVRRIKEKSTEPIFTVRYFIDTVVAQRARGLEFPYEYESEWYKLERPDLIIYLDVEEEERQRRLSQRGKGFLDKKMDESSFRMRFQSEFEKLEDEFVRVQTTNRSIDEIADEIEKIMEERF